MCKFKSDVHDNVFAIKLGVLLAKRVFSKTCELKSGVNENVCFNLKPCVFQNDVSY